MRRLVNILVVWVIFLGLVACGQATDNPIVTATTKAGVTSSPSAAPTAPLSPAVTPRPATATAIITPTTTAVSIGPTSVMENGVTQARLNVPFPAATGVPTKPDLSEHEVAMLPAFKGDVKLAQDLGAPVYNIAASLTINDTAPQVTAHEQVIYTNDTGENLDSVYFQLWANSDPDGQANPPVAVSNLKVNGQPSNWALANNRSMVKVILAQRLAPNTRAAIEMDFTLRVSTSSDSSFFRYTPVEQIFHLCYWYPQVAVYDKSFGGWDIHDFSPTGDVTNSKTSFFTVWLTAPTEQVIAANGKQTEIRANGDGTKTLKIVTGPVRDFAAIMSPQFQSATRQSGDTRVTTYFFEKDRPYGEKMLQYAVDSLKTYNDAFGTYPYAEYQAAEAVLSTFGGLEFPGLIYITTKYFNATSTDSMEYVVAHETGHQWWYGLVGSDQIRHPFQDESLTQFVPVLYFERLKGKAETQRIVQTYMRSGFVAAVRAGRDGVVDQPVVAWDQSQFNDYVSMVYNKGGYFYEAYREKFGEAAFLKFVRTYLQNNRYKFANPDDILEALKAGAGTGQAEAVATLYQHWIESKEGQQDVK